MAAMRCARAALGTTMPSWRSRRLACVGIMLRCPDSTEPTLLNAITEWADDFTVPLDDALSRLVSLESDDSDRDEEGASTPASPLRTERPGAAALPVSAATSLPVVGALVAELPGIIALRPYYCGAAAEPGRLGAPVKTFIQVTKTEGQTDRGYRAVPPLDPTLCAVFGVKPGLSDRCPTLKDQLTAKLTDRAHRCMMQQEAVVNNIALLAHNISTMAVDPHRLAEQAVDVAKTAGVILCLCSTGAVAKARMAPHTEESVAAADPGHP
ncbi:unnamed protein product [Boreogadus saida]